MKNGGYGDGWGGRTVNWSGCRMVVVLVDEVEGRFSGVEEAGTVLVGGCGSGSLFAYRFLCGVAWVVDAEDEGD